MTTQVPVDGFVRIRGLLGELIVTAKAWDAIYSQKGGFEYVGVADQSDIAVAVEPVEDEPDRELLERRRKVRGKSKEQIARMADGDPEEARLLFQAEQSGQNRPTVLEALVEVIGGGAA